jgi:glutathione S-transferase
MTLPILYSFRRCPYAMRARIVLYYSKISHEHREVDLKNKPQDMLDVSTKGTVPILLLPNASVLDQSLDIMYWALSRNDPNNWLPTSSATRKIANSVIEENDTIFKSSLDRYKYPDRYNSENISSNDDKNQCLKFMEKIESKIEGKNFILSDRISMVDIAIFPFIRQFSLVDETWFHSLPYTLVKKWLLALCESNLFNSVMNKFESWNIDQQKVIISFKE